ncbi:PAS domain S-box protein [Azospirillum sp. YIM DDC1]|uniref:PAS domain S-box protein n=1 Tax=Azospirillum aestuarii TaxID=2802052 RepID=A0ABS1I883_9PROT|nr:PAS domain-containing protein [Azospirillum aestuarii]MBK3776930.1 PAS domain S-box protein [Azospirillum brasilense]MBK4722912.1 PAS domain S-box protein [Azospirillum aestuarii]
MAVGTGGTHGTLTGRERTFHRDEIIVSKTDLKGRITYANDVFLRISGYSEAELLGQPHNIVRHPDMPRCVYKLLWSRIESGSEIFAYVINRAKDGDHYWVFAHVTPVFGNPDSGNGQTITGYHSSRRVPAPPAVEAAAGLYAALRAEEARHADRNAAMAASGAMLEKLLRDKGTSYDEFVFSL